MTDQALPTAELVQAVLAAQPGPWGAGARVLSVRDLSPGFGQAVVLRVEVATPQGGASPWIVKVPGWGGPSLLDSQDTQLAFREAQFLSGELPGRLPRGLATPPDATVLRHDGRQWIVMRDVGAALNRPWTPAAATTAARSIALLHLPATLDPALLDTPWLERSGHAAYPHHVPAAHENLDALAGHPLPADLFTDRQVRALHLCLDAAPKLAAQADELPATLVHGDHHPRNAGLDHDGTLVLIDWEHVGIGPVGFALATFVALYRAFGGQGDLDETALLAAYGQALSDLAGTDLRRPAALGFALAHLTWGLHLRLGPGLSAVRQGFHGDTPRAWAPHLDDIRTGSRRALSWAAAAGLGPLEA